MAYKALYRIYRPQKFDEVVGQKHILQTLKNAIKENKIAHAYLFSGPRGTGKTSMAKLLAKALNCECGDNTNRPCNECENCRSINEGTHPDVIELDAASNNGVDEVRDIIDKVKYAPIMGKYKVYIIDEVHMMTPGAFNALLKTLEEPPAHVIFILATTDVHKVLPTIVSRCQRFDFNRVGKMDMKKRIEDILIKEHISYTPDVIDLISELAEGGMRDALSILDQTIAYAGNTIGVNHIRDIYGIATPSELVNFLRLCNNNDYENVLRTIDDFEEKGLDFVRLTSSLIDVIKDSIIYINTKNEKLLKILDKEKALSLASGLTVKKLFSNIDILIDAQSNYRKVNNPQEFFTLAALKICENNNVKQDVVIKPVKEEKPTSIVNEVIETPISTQVETTIEPIIEETISTIETMDITEQVLEEEVSEPVIINTSVSRPTSHSKKQHKILFDDNDLFNIMSHATKKAKADLIEKWSLVKRYIDFQAFSKASNLLIDGQPCVACDNAIIFVFDSEHQAELVNIYENQLMISDLLKEIYGQVYYFYAITDEKFKDLRREYIEKRNNQELPPVADILPPRHEPIEEEEEENDEELEQAMGLFGDSIIIED